jgi:hypothetical protein
MKAKPILFFILTFDSHMEASPFIVLLFGRNSEFSGRVRGACRQASHIPFAGLEFDG